MVLIIEKSPTCEQKYFDTLIANVSPYLTLDASKKVSAAIYSRGWFVHSLEAIEVVFNPDEQHLPRIDVSIFGHKNMRNTSKEDFLYENRALVESKFGYAEQNNNQWLFVVYPETFEGAAKCYS